MTNKGFLTGHSDPVPTIQMTTDLPKVFRSLRYPVLVARAPTLTLFSLIYVLSRTHARTNCFSFKDYLLSFSSISCVNFFMSQFPCLVNINTTVSQFGFF